MRIDEAFHPAEIGKLVDEERAVASRLIFCDETIYRLELERVFGRAWLFVGHDSEIPEVGDFVTRVMGNDPVILVRESANKVNVLLNSCPHRGAMVCRADAGNGKGFTCPYHGWAFRTDGKLVATASDAAMYDGKVNFNDLDMRRVAKVGSYAGLIFATWNTDAPSLDEYLGNARWYMDLFFDRTPMGMEVLGPPHRWETQTNWKVGALNFGSDGPHAIKVHGPGTEATFGVPPAGMRAALINSPAVTWGNGHNGIAPLGPPGTPEFLGFDPDLVELYKKHLSPEQAAFRARLIVGVQTNFPNFSFAEGAASFELGKEPPVNFLVARVWQPLAVDRTQIWNWFLVEKEASEEWQRKVMLTGVRTFTAGGIFDPDDSEAWAAIARGVEGEQARKMELNFQMALAYRDQRLEGFPGPGTAYPSSFAEATEFDILCEWKKYMTGVK